MPLIGPLDFSRFQAWVAGVSRCGVYGEDISGKVVSPAKGGDDGKRCGVAVDGRCGEVDVCCGEAENEEGEGRCGDADDERCGEVWRLG